MNKQESLFVETVWRQYREQGRHDLPWRKTTNPYRILVSEIMLQQTQVDRVLPKYREFLRQFPTVRALAAASLSDVLRAWQGLGYNRRAKYLQEAARVVVEERKGKFPHDEPGWRSLPGVGPYTAAAVLAFAYNHPVVLIETNVRQVFLHHFFPRATAVPDAAILKLVAKTLPPLQAREWYSALMDYGAYLKSQHGNKNTQSKHYTKQSKFSGSDRQIRGAIIKTLTSTESLTEKALQNKLFEYDAGRVATQLARLLAEGLVANTPKGYQLA